jgi:FkbM family methyltransferase
MIGSVLRNLGILNGRQIGKQVVVEPHLLHQAFEENQLRKLLEYCEADCVFDVGANVGQYAQMMRGLVGYKGLLISFEPIPEAAAGLRELVKSTNDPNWIVEEIALSSQDGQQTLNIMRGSQFSSLSEPRHDDLDTELFRHLNAIERSVTVRTESLATALARLQAKYGFKRPFLKLDTQGYDVDIVSSAKDIMHRFVGLQSELAVRKLYAHSKDFRDAIRTYEECGFELTALVPNNEGHFPRLIEMDCIMIRSSLLKDTANAGNGRAAVA